MRPKPIAPSPEELRLIQRLRERPELRERLEALVSLVESPQGEICTADQIEEQLIVLIRDLGRTSMEQWAQGAEHRAAEQFKAEHPKFYVAKKND